MFRRLPLWFFLFFYFLLQGEAKAQVEAQENEILPILQTSRITAYDINEGLPISCTWDAFHTSDGRMWINPCFQQEEHQRFSFFQFDGRQTRYVDLGEEARKIKAQAALSGFDKDDNAFGFFRLTSTFFMHDFHDHSTDLINIEQSDAYIIQLFQHKDDHLVILAMNASSFFVYTHQLDKTELKITIPRDHPENPIPNLQKYWVRDAYVMNGDNLWFFDWYGAENIAGPEVENLMRVNLKSGGVNKDPAATFIGYTPQKDVYNFNWTAINETIQLLDITGKLFVYDFSKKQSSSRQLFIDPKTLSVRSLIVTDKAGNTLYALILENEKYGLLIDAKGGQYDYGDVLTRLNAYSRYPVLTIKGLYSNNFLQNVLAVSKGGLITADLKPATSIRYFITNQPTRGIAELSDQGLLVFSEQDGVIRINTATHQVINFTRQAPFDGVIAGLGDLKTRPDGSVWFIQDSALIRLDPQLNPTKHPLHLFIERFDFINDSVVVLVTNKHLLLYNIVEKKLRSLVETPSSLSAQASFNQVLIAKNGNLWIAGYDGLWYVDVARRQSKVYNETNGFSDRAMMCLAEDNQGKIWVGTYSGGLNIFDPVSGKVNIINASQGLSNNTVVSILQDEEGMMWLATYVGITLVSPDGQVRARLYKEDGLSTNEFNRYSSFKTKNGDLIFGSVAGINRIKPAEVKRELFNQDALRIYGNSVTYYDRDQKTDKEYNFDITSREIRLPATHRYLSIKFALSEFVNPEEHQYSYRIVHPGRENINDWISNGSNPELNLNNLPVGNYTIEVRGKDYRGNTTLVPLKILIHAAEFFYKQVWFYLLLSLMILTGGVLWILRERKERIRLEQVVTDRTKKIREDKEIIERQSQKLIELDHAKSIFFTNISHEFRTPLTVIEGMTEHVREDPNAPVLIRRNASHLLNLVNQILDLRKIESGAMTLNVEQRDVIQFIRYITESYRSLAHVKGIEFELKSTVDKLMMDFDQEKLRQIIVNLLSNAIKFTPNGSAPLTNGGKIEMQVSTYEKNDEEYLELKIVDTGIGIPKESIKDIFNRFYQAEQVDKQKLSPSGGTGIGLTIAAEFIRLMKGTVEVESEVGKGSTFTVTLPVTRDAPMAESREQIAGGMEQGAWSMTGKAEIPQLLTNAAGEQETSNLPSLLIIEDNSDVIYYLQSSLQTDYQITVAHDGKQGLGVAFDIIPDLIICDVMMPEMDGFEVCDILKKDLRTSHVPLLMLTGRADDESRIVGLTKGADAYLSKPFDVRILRAQLTNLYESRKRIHARYASLDLPQRPSDDPGIQVEDNFILKLREIIETNMQNEDLQVPDVAQAIGMSRANLHRKITALTGKPVSTFIRTVRLNKAKQLLLDPSLNVSQVGYEVGFKYPETFTRAFSEEFGMTPSQYRSGGEG
ncbi:MAG TPA: ATP-binding protein [Saprospiraceae bacterium]|nr:ATP-binding protein [Saprospiraceae bacterium]